jgi:hypothetical protein
MEAVPVKIVPRGFGETRRRDWWWIGPMTVFVGLVLFIAYATWAAFQNAHYTYGPYLSPFYAPELFGASEHSWFGPMPGWWPALIPFSPALLILPGPLSFRLTCYYYRGAYYKAFWADPVSCAVGEPRGTSYWGERYFPLILQNIHRYALYVAVVFLFLLAWDVWLALWFIDPETGQTEFGIGVGTLVLALNVVLLSCYTLGCHSMRHLVGGVKDAVSGSRVRSACYTCSSSLNERHQLYAWCSLFSVGFADLYVRLCSMGIFTDVTIF